MGGKKRKRFALYCTPINYSVPTCPSPVASQHKELVTWLVPGQHNIKHDEACSRWQETGRCTWILENETFTKWRSDRGFLWLHGIRAFYLPMLCMMVTSLRLTPSWEWQVYTHVSHSGHRIPSRSC